MISDDDDDAASELFSVLLRPLHWLTCCLVTRERMGIGQCVWCETITHSPSRIWCVCSAKTYVRLPSSSDSLDLISYNKSDCRTTTINYTSTSSTYPPTSLSTCQAIMMNLPDSQTFARTGESNISFLTFLFPRFRICRITLPIYLSGFDRSLREQQQANSVPRNSSSMYSGPYTTLPYLAEKGVSPVCLYTSRSHN